MSINRFEYCEIPKCTEDEIAQMGLCLDVDCGTGGDCYLNKWVFCQLLFNGRILHEIIQSSV